MMGLRFAAVAVAGLALCAGAITGARAEPPDDLVHKQAQASQVLADIQQLDARFERTVESWNQARLALAKSRQRLAGNRVALHRAVVRSRRADAQRADRLVAIWKQGGEPSDIEILLARGTSSATWPGSTSSGR